MAMTKPTSEQITFTSSGVGATATTVQAKLRESVSVRDFGAIGDGTTDDSAAILLALTAANGEPVLVPDGSVFRIDTLGNTTLTVSVHLYGGGTLDGGNAATSGFKFGNGIGHVRSHGITYQNIDAPVMSASATTNTIGEVTFEGNTITDCQNGLFFLCVAENVICSRNRVRNLEHNNDVAAFWFGNGTYASQDAMEKFIISENEITSVASTVAGEEAHAVILYGREAVVTGNIIESVSNPNGANCEAIYTKCRFVQIANNVLTDCSGLSSQNSANIAIKGSVRSSTSSSQGFGVSVTNNLLYSSSGAVAGIRVEQEDVIVSGNYLEGFGGSAIYTASGTFNNVQINDNTIRNHRGAIAIQSQHIGSGFSIARNRIFNLSASEGVIADALGISVSNAAGALSELSLFGNEIYDDGNCAATTRIKGIRLSVSSTRTVNRLRIADNKISISHASIAEFGIDLSNSGTITDFQCVNNDLSGVPASTTTYPIFDQGVFSAAGYTGKIEISGNLGWGPVYALPNSAFNIEAYHCGTTFTNAAYSQARTVTLPVSVPGLWYSFQAIADFDLQIDPDGSEVIRGGTAGQYLSLDTLGDSVTLRCFAAGTWEIVCGYGSYTYA